MTCFCKKIFPGWKHSQLLLLRLLVLAAPCLHGPAAWSLTCLLPIPGGDAAQSVLDIRPAGEKPRFIGAGNGLFRIDGGRLLPVEGGDAAAWVRDIRPADEYPRFVRADNGLFRFDGDRLVRVEGVDTWVHGFRSAQENPRFVRAGERLLRIDGDRLVRVEGADEAWINGIRPADETPRFVSAKNGLFRIDDDRLVRVKGGDAAKGIWEIRPADENPRFVGAENGLFRIDGDRLVRVEGGDAAKGIWEIRPADENPRFVSAENGLFRIDGERLIRVEGGDAAEMIWEIRPEGEKPRIVVSENGVFRIEDDRLLPLYLTHASLMYSEIGPANQDPNFVILNRELFWIEHDRVVPVEGSVLSGDILKMSPAHETPRFVGAENGLFMIEDDRLVPVGGADSVSWVREISPEGDNPRLVGAQNGLFRIVPPHDPDVIKTTEKVSLVKTSTHTLRWEVRSDCFALVSGEFAVRLIGDPEIHPTDKFPLQGGDSLGVVATLPIKAEDGGTVSALLQFRENETEEWRDLEHSLTKIEVNWSVTDHAVDKIKRYSSWVVAGHALLFTGLLFAARWSTRAWKILSDPIWNKTFLWFWFAMRHVSMLQRWPLGRWFDARQDGLKVVPHVPLPLAGPGESKWSSADLATETKPRCRIWVQGNTGMGKTALAEHLATQWFEGLKQQSPNRHWTLADAYRTYGYVLIPIALRDYATVSVPEPAEEWLFELVGREFARNELPIADRQLLKDIVTSGKLVLLLDGANEVDDCGAINQFAMRFPNVGLVVTSQTLPSAEGSDTFEVWRLPASIENAVKPLLDEWLEKSAADAVIAEIAGSPIQKDIKSGYDVRLLADLVEAGTIPEDLPDTRMGLYEAMLERARIADGSVYPKADLCQVTWKVWALGERQLVPGDNIPQTLLDPLLLPGVRIIRPAHDGLLEFRHDQMRGYLAARWVALEVVSPIDLLEETESIWRLGRSEQQTVWNFLAELIDSERGPPLLQWSTLEAERAELQVALRRVALRDHWPLKEPILFDR